MLAHSPQFHNFNLVEFKRPFPAPSFSLSQLSQTSKTLDDYQGHYVLLNFWATWCLPCLQEMPSLEKLYQRFQDQGLVVVAISSDEEGASQVEPFVQRLKLTFPILLDADQTVSQKYGARNLPSTFLIDPDGNVIGAAKGERDWYSEGAQSYIAELLAK